MKILIAFLISFLMGSICMAQTSSKYNIKVIDHERLVNRGVFYSITPQQLVLIKKNGDTLSLNTSTVSSIIIQKRGIIAPLTLIGAGIFLTYAIFDGGSGLDQAALLIGGPVIGGAIGCVTGELLANKKYYKKLQPKDFEDIINDLKKYSQIK